jgi:hypothetical protein
MKKINLSLNFYFNQMLFGESIYIHSQPNFKKDGN